MNPSDDKRHFSRFPIEGSARLECECGNHASRLLDISLKGALIARPAAWNGKVGDRCQLHASLNDSEVTIAMEAVVAHVHGEMVGFRCTQIDLESISHLRRLVELNLGDEQLLGRELGELVAQQEA